MKKAFLTLLFLLGLALPARAQIGNTTTILFAGAPSGTCAPLSFAINTATGDLYDCLAGAWHAVGGGMGGGSPAAPDGSIQYNAGSGMFGAVPTSLAAGNADCDGFMDACAFLYSYDSSMVFEYFIFGTDTNGAMGNTFDFYQNGGCWTFDTNDGTIGGSLYSCPTVGNLSVGFGATFSGFSTKQDFLSVGLSRFMFLMPAAQTPGPADYALSAGWGDMATVDSSLGTDNNPKVQITSAGTGQGANPTVTFTYKNGAFGNTSNDPTFVCQMSDSTDAFADITHTETTTALTMTARFTPVAGETYVISCFGATAGDN